jgi:uncharacterized protein (TIGR02996 family)
MANGATMTDLYALLAACKDAPEDDAVRLILADWLEENGDEPARDRAEFLRLECEYRHLPYLDAREAGLLTRMYRLAIKNERAWLAPILERLSPAEAQLRGGFVGVDPHPKQIRKGLPDGADPVFSWLAGLTLRGWDLDRRAQHAVLTDPRLATFAHLYIADLSWTTSDWQKLNRARPPARLRSIRVPGQPGKAYGAALAACPLFAEVRSLDLRHGDKALDDDALVELARAPWLAGVTHLNLNGNQIGPRGLRALCESPNLGALQHLNLTYNPLGDAGVEILASCPRLASLTALDLSSNHLGPATAQALASSPHLRRLDRLNLSQNSLDDSSMIALAASPLLASVRHLDVGFNELSPAAIEAVTHSPSVRSLHTLTMSGAPVSAKAAAAVVDSENLAGLRVLGFVTSTLGKGALRALATGSGLPQLTTLDLRYAEADTQVLRELTRADGLPALTSLSLYPVDGGAALGKALSTSPLLRRLRRLLLLAIHMIPAGLDGLCELINEGNLEDLALLCHYMPEKVLKQLAACPGLRRLVRLDLSETKGIRLRGLRALVTSPHLSGLKMLNLRYCTIRKGVRALREMGLDGLTWLELEDNKIPAEEADTVAALRRERPDVYVNIGYSNFNDGHRGDRQWTLADRDPDD